MVNRERLNRDSSHASRDQSESRSFTFNSRFDNPSTSKVIRMPPYDDWNKIDEEDEEELQDFSVSIGL